MAKNSMKATPFWIKLIVAGFFWIGLFTILDRIGFLNWDKGIGGLP